jgi:hypothetical protein
MTERLRTSRLFGKRTGPGDTPPYGSELLAVPAVPSPQPPVDDADELTIFGFPALGGAYDVGGRGTEDRPDRMEPAQDGGLDTLVRLTTQHRADSIAGLTLMLAGVAATASLWFPWARGDGATGLALLRRSFAVAGAGLEALDRSDGQWEPLAIVLGGALLVPLGVLLFIPSRTHRIMGLLALCAAIAVTAGVVSRFAQAEWSWAGFDRGMWCAVAAAALGILGALKAMLRIPRVTLREARPFHGEPPDRRLG